MFPGRYSEIFGLGERLWSFLKCRPRLIWELARAARRSFRELVYITLSRWIDVAGIPWSPTPSVRAPAEIIPSVVDFWAHVGQY